MKLCHVLTTYLGGIMKVQRTKSILKTLFLPYTTIFILFFVCIVIFFSITETKKIYKNSFSSIENNLISTSESFDQMINTMDSISQNVLYSNLVKEHFNKYIDYTNVPWTSSDYKNIQNTKTLYELLVALMGPNTPVDQIYLYGLSIGCFGVGLDNSTSTTSVMNYPWYNTVLEKNGRKHVFRDSDKRLYPYYSYKEGRHFLSLVREYYSSLNVPQGIIEVKKSMKPFIDTMNSFNMNYKEKIYIFSPDGEIIYPIYDTTAKGPSYYKIISDSITSQASLDVASTTRSGNDYILYQTSRYSGFTTAAIINKDSLMSPIRNYIYSILIIFFCISIVFIIVSYIVSQRISKPLGHIYKQISSFQVTSETLTAKELPEIDTPILELNGLYKALIRMQTQARSSLEKELKLQNREMQSRMLALQAQMNPHFLYNSLATIQAMADEGMTKEIEMMCQNMSDILRYISSDSQELVELQDEIIHTRSYLECMRIRYDNELSYTFDIPEEMMTCKIPKLCLQLIVENAVKFSTQKRSPWKISITGRITLYDWEIQVRDNGPGFSTEELKILNAKIDEINKTGLLPNLEIHGMGLMNIYIRLKLLYKQAPIYRLANNATEGASVTIGGSIK